MRDETITEGMGLEKHTGTGDRKPCRSLCDRERERGANGSPCIKRQKPQSPAAHMSGRVAASYLFVFDHLVIECLNSGNRETRTYQPEGENNMTKRIQAYFRTEDEAQGAKTALISYKIEEQQLSPLTDPLDTSGDGDRSRTRNILVPLAPYNNSAMAGGIVGTAGTTGSVMGAAILPGVVAPDSLDEKGAPVINEDKAQKSDTAAKGDLDGLHYVMELKVAEENYNEVVETLRGKNAYVELFE